MAASPAIQPRSRRGAPAACRSGPGTASRTPRRRAAAAAPKSSGPTVGRARLGHLLVARGPSCRRTPRPTSAARRASRRRRTATAASVRAPGRSGARRGNDDQRASKATVGADLVEHLDPRRQPRLDRVLGQQPLGERVERADGRPVELIERLPARYPRSPRRGRPRPPSRGRRRMRSRSSAPAFSVKVMAATRRSSTLPSDAPAPGPAVTRADVFPDPAPASTKRVERRDREWIRSRAAWSGAGRRTRSRHASDPLASDPSPRPPPGVLGPARSTELHEGRHSRIRLLALVPATELDDTHVVGVTDTGTRPTASCSMRSGGAGSAPPSIPSTIAPDGRADVLQHLGRHRVPDAVEPAPARRTSTRPAPEHRGHCSRRRAAWP